jgi:uncharacterized protein
MADVNVRSQVNQIALQFAICLQESMKLHSLYIYGSYAKGHFTEDSDIDIAVVADGFSGDLVDDTFMLMKIRRKVDNRIEPHPFSLNEFNENDPVAREIIRTGIRVV